MEKKDKKTTLYICKICSRCRIVCCKFADIGKSSRSFSPLFRIGKSAWVYFLLADIHKLRLPYGVLCWTKRLYVDKVNIVLTIVEVLSGRHSSLPANSFVGCSARILTSKYTITLHTSTQVLRCG